MSENIGILSQIMCSFFPFSFDSFNENTPPSVLNCPSAPIALTKRKRTSYPVSSFVIQPYFSPSLVKSPFQDYYIPNSPNWNMNSEILIDNDESMEIDAIDPVFKYVHFEIFSCNNGETTTLNDTPDHSLNILSQKAKNIRKQMHRQKLIQARSIRESNKHHFEEAVKERVSRELQRAVSHDSSTHSASSCMNSNKILDITKSFIELLTINIGKENSSQRRYSEEFYKYSFMLKYWYNPYETLRTFLPFPSVQSLNTYFDDNLSQCVKQLSNIKKTTSLVNSTLHTMKSYNDKSVNDFTLIMSVDAIDIKLFRRSNSFYKSIFIFFCLPSKADEKGFLIHAILHQTGKASKDIRDRIMQIIHNVNKMTKVYIPILAVDGDPGYNKMHCEQFELIENAYDQGGFTKVVEMIANSITNKEKTWIITDMIHYAKNRRTQCIINELQINGTSVNMEALLDIMHSSGAINDKSSLSKLQDAFPVEIFNFEVLKQVMAHPACDSDLVLYMFPMCCWLETCLNMEIDKESRLFLLKTSFLLYMRIFKIQKDEGNQYQTQISLIRALNTIPVIYEEFNKAQQTFAFDHYSTMPQEHFHGHVRGVHTNDDSAEAIFNSIAKAHIIKQIKHELNMKPTVRSRLSVGGIHWDYKKHTLNAVPNCNESDIIEFLFANSSFGGNSSYINNQIILQKLRNWIDSISIGTLIFKTHFTMYQGRHILSRQITNSQEYEKRFTQGEDNEIYDTDMEKTNFENEISDFHDFIKEKSAA